MEQYNYQQPVVIEPEKKPIGLQIAALVFGIIGLGLGFMAYFATIFSNIGVAIAVDQHGATQGAGIATGIIIGVDIFLAIFCLVAAILGVIGLVRSIRRPTRTVKGIVLSAIGLNCAMVGFALMVIGAFIGGIFRLLISTGAIH